MFKLVCILSVATLTTSLRHQENPADYASQGGYYLVFENAEENPVKGVGGETEGHQQEGIEYVHAEEAKSYGSPVIEYVFVQSKQDDRHSRFDHGQRHHGQEKKEERQFTEYYNDPKYKFYYDVRDSHTGDFKTHEESREGDTVKGWYSLLEPDGTILEVHYAADEKTGFKARVDRKGKIMRTENRKHYNLNY